LQLLQLHQRTYLKDLSIWHPCIHPNGKNPLQTSAQGTLVTFATITPIFALHHILDHAQMPDNIQASLLNYSPDNICIVAGVDLYVPWTIPLKAGEENPHAREEEGKLYLLTTEHSSSLAGIPRMWGLKFHGKATAFTNPTYNIGRQCGNKVIK